MDVRYRLSNINDIPFMTEMLYEAVFWRSLRNRPPLEEGIKLPGVIDAIKEFGSRVHDIAVIAENHTNSLGAAWIRYYNDESKIRGYIDEATPVLVIAVKEEYRRQHIATNMIEWIKAYISPLHINRISLCVTKDNIALGTYLQTGFKTYEDIGDSLVMIYESKQ